MIFKLKYTHLHDETLLILVTSRMPRQDKTSFIQFAGLSTCYFDAIHILIKGEKTF